MTSGDPLRVELGEVTTLTLRRPEKYNAMTAEMGACIEAAVTEINTAEAPRVVVIRGEGRAFSAGGDFDLLEKNAASRAEENERTMRAFYAKFLSVLRLRVPSIAVLHGATVGAGLCFAAACDLRIAAREAKLGVNFVRVGLHPGMGATVLLPHLVGAARATDLLLTGRLLLGDEAERIGLVHRAVPREELDRAVQQCVDDILAGAPLAIGQTKQTLLGPLLDQLDAGLGREAAAQAISFATDDLREAVAAFRQGRKPRFVGK